MRGSCGQAADGADQLFAAEGASFCNSAARNQYSQRGATGHRCHAAFGLKANLFDALAADFESNAQNVAAGGVLQLRRRVRAFHNAGIARMLEVVEKLGRVHRRYCAAPAA